METQRLICLLDKYKDNSLNEQEYKELEQWYDSLNIGTTALTEQTEVQELSDEMLTQFRQSRLKPAMPVGKWGFFKMFTRVAAVITGVSIMGAGAYFLFFSKPQKEIIATETWEHPKKNDVAAGGNKALLTLANGEQIILDSATNGTLAQQGNAKVVKLSNGELAYNTTGDDTNNVLYNTMSTPRGGQYKLTLPDGSEVWLNAASSISYPTTFVGKERQVEITGEAYFEVAPLSPKGGQGKIPFIVKINTPSADGEEVEVLGTHFNVNAYNGEGPVKTTLLEGSVKLTHHYATILIKPGQQTAFTEKGFSITEPDMEKVIAWKTGFFDFDNTGLAAIMRQVSRWYDVDIVYQGQLTSATFGGRISRNLSLSKILKMLEENGVAFRLEGKTLVVRP